MSFTTENLRELYREQLNGVILVLKFEMAYNKLIEMVLCAKIHANEIWEDRSSSSSTGSL